jgi:acetyl esterase/lipase
MRSHVVLDLVRAARTVVARRARSGPSHPAWSFPFELAVEGLRESRRRIQALPIEAQRLAWEAMQVPSPSRGRLSISEVDDAPVPSLRCVPEARSEGGPVLLYLHGGAYNFGSFATHGDLIARIAMAGGARTFVPDYRLAPEHPFPAALDDAVAFYRYLLDREDPARIVVAGDSAGGGLSVALLVRARELGLPQPAGAALVCPWVDLSARASGEQGALDWVDEAWGAAFGAEYLAGHDPEHPHASPAFADLRGLPPLLVQTGDAEILHPQILGFVERARASGVSVELEVSHGMIHNFHMLASVHAPSRRAIASIGRFLRRETSRPRTPGTRAGHRGPERTASHATAANE